MPENFRDPYIDSETGTLRNLVGAMTYDELQNAEGEFVALRMSELFASPLPKVTGSLDDFCFLHRTLFQAALSRTPCRTSGHRAEVPPYTKARSLPDARW